METRPTGKRDDVGAVFVRRAVGDSGCPYGPGSGSGQVGSSRKHLLQEKNDRGFSAHYPPGTCEMVP